MSDKTPLLDELEKGPWPSYVKEIKRAAKKNAAAKDLLRIQEQSYQDRVTHWKHGGIVGVTGYGGGVIGRYCDAPEKFPEVASFHTMRINQPAGWFYTTKALRKVCDIWEKYGSGMTNFHGATGDIILLGTTTENLQPCFDTLSEAGFDLGGSGSALRTPTACVGQARCEWANIDTMALIHDLTMTYQDELHRPRWPYKFKIKASGCPNDCVAAIARADFTIIGTWRDSLRIDQAAVREYVNEGLDIRSLVVDNCPTEALAWDEKSADADPQGGGLRPLHALHQHDAEGVAARPPERGDHPDRRQGAYPQGRQPLLGADSLHRDNASVYRDQRAAREDLGLVGRTRKDQGATRRTDRKDRAEGVPAKRWISSPCRRW